jgi:hypothetical protein
MKTLTTLTPGRALFLGVLCLLVFAMSPINGGGQAESPDRNIEAEKLTQPHFIAGHGMLVLGNKDNIYLLHLAMRTHPAHQFQLILKVDLEAGPTTRIGDRSFVGEEISLDSTGANQVYFLDRNHTDNKVSIYTLRPRERFPLIEVIAGDRTGFRGDFVRGHFELDANPPDILTNVTVRVKDILYAQHLKKPAFDVPHPLETGKLEFLLFGAGDEYFISHKITLHGEKKKPNNNGFHQVFVIKKSTAERLKVDLTRRTALLEINDDHASEEGRLPDTGGKFPCQLKQLDPCIEISLPLDMEVLPEHYLEVLM